MEAATCKSCGAQIAWVVTESGKRMPLDYAPQQMLMSGSFVVDETFEGNPVARSVKAVYISHFATCPNAASHRR